MRVAIPFCRDGHAVDDILLSGISVALLFLLCLSSCRLLQPRKVIGNPIETYNMLATALAMLMINHQNQNCSAK